MDFLIIYLTGVVTSFILATLINVFNDKIVSTIRPFLEKMEFEPTPNRHLLTWKDHWNDMKWQVLLSWVGAIFSIGFYTFAVIFSVYLRMKDDSDEMD